MPVKIKVCGVNSEAAIEAAAEAGADWVGFVFFARSPRHVTPARAASLAGRAGAAQKIGLFVDPSDADIDAALSAMKLDALQLYVDDHRFAAIAARCTTPLWRALPIQTAADLPQSSPAKILVVEPRPAPGATRPGGNATKLDWPLLAGWTAPVPWLLAGGLTPENVAEAIRQSGASAVDVSSGVESAPGQKDPGLIRKFVHAARRAKSED